MRLTELQLSLAPISRLTDGAQTRLALFDAVQSVGLLPILLLSVGVGATLYGGKMYVTNNSSTSSHPRKAPTQQASPSRIQRLQTKIRSLVSRNSTASTETEPETHVHLQQADEELIDRATQILEENGEPRNGDNLNRVIAELTENTPADRDTTPESPEQTIGLVGTDEQYKERIQTQLAPDEVVEEASKYTVRDETGDKRERRQIIIHDAANELPITLFDKFQTSGLRTTDAQVKLTFAVHPLDDQTVKKRLRRQVRTKTVDIERKHEKGRVDTLSDQNQLETADSIWQQIKTGNDTLVDLGVYIEISAPDETTLDKATAEARDDLRKAGVKTTPFYDKQAQGWVSGQLAGPDVAQKATPMNLEALRAFFPFKDPNLIHPEGGLLGLNLHTHSPLIVNPFKLSGHAVSITGKIGSGKSYLAGIFTSDLLSMNPDLELLIIDPRGGLTDLVTARDGQIIDITSETVINPLRIEPISNRDALSEMEGHPYDNKVDSVVQMIRAHFETETNTSTESLTKNHEGVLRRALYHTYLEQGITKDIETHDNPSPIIADLRTNLDHMAKGDDPQTYLDVPPELTDRIRDPVRETSQEIAHNINLGLEDFAPGGQYDQLNGQSEVSLDTSALMFDLSGVPEKENNLFMHIVLDWLFQRAKRTQNKNIICIDEVHYMFRSQQATEMLNLYTRQSRHNLSSMIFISQTVDEFLRNPQAKDIYDQCDIKALMYHADIDDDVADTLNLTDSDRRFIETAARGKVADHAEALTIVGDSKMQIEVRTDPFTEAFGDKNLNPWENGLSQNLISPDVLPPDKRHLAEKVDSPDNRGQR